MSSIQPHNRFPLGPLDSVEDVTNALSKHFDETTQKTIALIPKLLQSLDKLDDHRKILVEYTDSVKNLAVKNNIDIKTYRYFLIQWGNFVRHSIKVRSCYENTIGQLASCPTSREVLQCKMQYFQSRYYGSLSHAWLGFNQRHKNEVSTPQTNGVFSMVGKNVTLECQRVLRHIPLINNNPEEIEKNLLELYEKLIKEKNIQIDLSDDGKSSDELILTASGQDGSDSEIDDDRGDDFNEAYYGASRKSRSSYGSVASDQAPQEASCDSDDGKSSDELLLAVSDQNGSDSEIDDDRGDDFNEAYYYGASPKSRSSHGSIASDQAPQEASCDSDDGETTYGPIEVSI